eukprot:5829263-Amphidinium_carterae.1
MADQANPIYCHGYEGIPSRTARTHIHLSRLNGNCGTKKAPSDSASTSDHACTYKLSGGCLHVHPLPFKTFCGSTM